jgi:hypothetical protein
MKYLSTYKIYENEKANKTKAFFEDKINFDLINTIKDMSLEYLDNGDKLSYSVSIEYSTIITGQFSTRDPKVNWDNMSDIEIEIIKKRFKLIPKDYMHWTNFYDDFYHKAVESWNEIGKLFYGIMLHHQEENEVSVRNKEGCQQIFSRIKLMFPDEKVYILQ